MNVGRGGGGILVVPVLLRGMAGSETNEISFYSSSTSTRRFFCFLPEAFDQNMNFNLWQFVFSKVHSFFRQLNFYVTFTSHLILYIICPFIAFIF